MWADIILTIATITFVIADLRQAFKLFRNYEYDTKGFSKWHFRLKIFSLDLVIIAYMMLEVYFALCVAILQLLINVYIFKRIGGFKHATS